ncbi:hypothetical protein [Actinomadura rudentiformis]|uniref:Uncharacterized protein n=1 Tax=Actinomadura rudentiformis TaxID=359158 RepID=A0A6H9YYH6_9ACTN|nr:hypothetical protein [Actinomadura rudentiformis]KAB2351583.1 hypothetical protein F8566_04985 [Actinomadura rudentiformis]
MSTGASSGASSGARHGLGVLAGVIATPLVGAGLVVGFERLEEYRRQFVRFASTTSPGLVAGAILAVTAAVIAVLVASRLSPLASLIPGAVFTAYGLVWLLKPIWASDQVPDLPDRYRFSVMTMSVYGIPFLVGMVLLAGSLLPSRWRSRTPAAAGTRLPAGPPPPGTPGGPPPHAAMPGAPSPMYGREQQQPYGRGPSPPPPPYGQPPGPAAGPSQSPGASPGPGGIPTPRPAQAPPPPQAPPPAKPSQGSQPPSDDEPGEWTRMYGGDDLKDGGGSR